MASVAASSISPHNKKIVWFWLSNPNQFNEKEKEEWTRYSDFENEFIEEAYQSKKEEVELNDYIINFKYNMQTKKNDKNKQRPVKREAIDVSKYVREGRFSFPERAIAVKSFADASIAVRFYNIPFIYESDIRAEVKDAKVSTGAYYDYRELAELAAQGILKEGKLLNQEFDAQRMADQLRQCTSDEEIKECAVRLYSAESFLYKLLNSTLRNEDMSKVDTLGSFCVLLLDRLIDASVYEGPVLYRGATLTDVMVEEYKQAVDDRIRWLTFTSTTKNRRVAEQFGNSLFIIDCQHTVASLRNDISTLSLYPNEEEVLLGPGYQFKVDKVEFDEISGKYLIYMRPKIV